MPADAQTFLQGMVGAIFVFAAVGKVVSRASVAPLLLAAGGPPRIVRALAPLVPLVELVIGGAVLTGLFLSVPGACAVSLVFVWVQARSRRRDAQVACNCFGRLDLIVPQSVPAAHAVLLALASAALLTGTPGAPPSASEPLAAGAATGVTAILGSLLLGTAWEFRRRRATVLSEGARA